jgi:hypothetical protein
LGKIRIRASFSDAAKAGNSQRLYRVLKNSILSLFLGGAAVHRCDQRPSFQYWLYSLLKNSSFVSGHRFSDAVSSLNSDAPLGAGHSKRSFSANCLAAAGDCRAQKEFLALLTPASLATRFSTC